jgi:hypothetical protein
VRNHGQLVAFAVFGLLFVFLGMETKGTNDILLKFVEQTEKEEIEKKNDVSFVNDADVVCLDLTLESSPPGVVALEETTSVTPLSLVNVNYVLRSGAKVVLSAEDEWVNVGFQRGGDVVWNQLLGKHREETFEIPLVGPVNKRLKVGPQPLVLTGKIVDVEAPKIQLHALEESWQARLREAERMFREEKYTESDVACRDLIYQLFDWPVKLSLDVQWRCYARAASLASCCYFMMGFLEAALREAEAVCKYSPLFSYRYAALLYAQDAVANHEKVCSILWSLRTCRDEEVERLVQHLGKQLNTVGDSHQAARTLTLL